MRLVLSFIAGVLLLPGAVKAQQAEPLLNGKDLGGWYAFAEGTGKHQKASDLFKVEDHMIRLYGPKAGYLATDRVFKNFELTVEFRWNMDKSFVRKMDNRNSGLMYLVPEAATDMLWPQGYQFQIKQGSTGDFILLHRVTLRVRGKVRGPGKSLSVKKLTAAEKPAGEWNTLKLSVRNGTIKQTLNGVLVNEGSDPSIHAGRIVLMYEGFPIDFRDITIKTFH